MEKELTGYNFATGRVTRPPIVTLRAVAQGRAMTIAARTMCGVEVVLVPVFTVTFCIEAAGAMIPRRLLLLSRCAVSRNYKIMNIGESTINV